MEAHLVPTPYDPLEPTSLRCAGASPAPPVGWRDDGGRLVVADDLPDKLRAGLAGLPPDERPSRIVLAPHDGTDPLGPNPYLQSATFLTASAALEAGVGIALLTRGVAARGFLPLFARYQGWARAHVAVASPEHEPADAAPWSARLETIAMLAAARVPTWLRLDPAVPSRIDDPNLLERWISDAADAGVCGVVVAPLVLDDRGRAVIGDEPGVLDYYRPGRRRPRGSLPPSPSLHLPTEREAALAWRVRRVAEDLGLPTRLCRCARSVAGACGLASRRRAPLGDGQLSLAVLDRPEATA